jgi:hypothetical protein
VIVFLFDSGETGVTRGAYPRRMRSSVSWVSVGLVVGGLLAGEASARVVQPFPPLFLWGTAIAGFQSEMGVGAPSDPTTDWWVWVHDPTNVASGRVMHNILDSLR